MDLRSLQYFLAIAQELNITKAAEVLHMAQPPLSRQLQQLEEELDTPLFIRGKRKLELTEEGRLLKKRAKQILNFVDVTRTEIKEVSEGVAGTLRIGATQTIATTLLPGWIAAYKKKYPQVRYHIWSGNSDEVIAQLEHGLVDIAVIREPYNPEKFKGVRIAKEPWCVLIPGNSPLAELPGDSIDLALLDEQELIVPSIESRRREMEQWFETIGKKANICCEYAPLINAPYLVEQGVGIAVLPYSVKNILNQKNVVLKKIANPEVNSYVAVLVDKYHPLSKAGERFLELRHLSLAESLE
ncbi:MAG: LysR family transcriptional regulator [Lachnospiraceae bacterium]|nr:LysR family transcriptional regulator [Lachnospiraceae bacterium]